MERLLYIDILKGFAIILVVMGHMFVPYTSYLDSSVNQMIYSIHMPLFFFLSGLVFHVKIEKPCWFGKILIKKGMSLLIPYICFSALYSFCMGLSYRNLLFNDEMHNGYWFTLVLFEITFISLIVKLINKYDWVINLFLILLLMGIAKMGIIPEPYNTIFSTDKVAKFYMFFQMGVFVNNYGFLKKIFNSSYTYAICSIVYIVLFVLVGYDLQRVNICSFVLPFCGIVVLTNIAKKYESVLDYKGLLSWLGKHSLEIYLIHFFILSAMPKYIIDCDGVILLQIILLLFLSGCCIAISLAAALIIHQNSIFSFVFLGKGKLFKQLLSKL